MAINIPADCPFCRTNGLLKGAVIAESQNAFLIATDHNTDSYLIIPSQHAESLQDLPDTWWADVNQLLAKIPNLPSDFNLSLNMGKQAGQTVKHLHFWIIPRQADKPASGKGFARLISEADGRTNV
jgi:diadenosine tetraphosphate (Ap4A) HIT family hydrolase